MSSSDLLGHQAYTWCADVDASKTLIQGKKKRKRTIEFFCVPTPMFYTLLKQQATQGQGTDWALGSALPALTVVHKVQKGLSLGKSSQPSPEAWPVSSCCSLPPSAVSIDDSC